MSRPAPLLQVRDLSVRFQTRRRTVDAVRDLSFDVAPGETLAIVGESGSGKSVTALALMRLVERDGGRIVGGSARFDTGDEKSMDLLSLAEPAMRSLRGNRMSMIFQEPMTSLNPVLTVGDQVREVLALHRGLDVGATERAAIELMERVQLTDPERRLGQYPHELSGGMRQRVMIAIAIACTPRLLIADEPTTALDVTVQAGILALLADLQRDSGTAIVFITHDMGVVAQIADRVVVMKDGAAVESSDTVSIFGCPQATYTQTLLSAVPHIGAGGPAYRAPAQPRETATAAAAAEDAYVLRVEHLVTRFPVRKGPFRRHVANVHAVEGVSLTLKPGETLGLVGESGSGKSSIGRSILRLIEPTAGSIYVDGRDVTGLSPAAMRPLRRHLQMVFQDPYASLNPRLNVADLVTEPLAIHTDMSAADRREVASGLLQRVGLPAECLERYPHQFSGGQRQRLCIARALSSQPQIIIANEPVSALDVSVQRQVIDLMRGLQETFGIAYLFISHDLAVVEQMSHRVAVLDRGRVVETGPVECVLRDPCHAYTRQLLAAVPVPDPARRRQALDVVARERRSPIHPLGYEPPPQHFEEVASGHLVARE